MTGATGQRAQQHAYTSRICHNPKKVASNAKVAGIRQVTVSPGETINVGPDADSDVGGISIGAGRTTARGSFEQASHSINDSDEICNKTNSFERHVDEDFYEVSSVRVDSFFLGGGGGGVLRQDRLDR